MKLELIKERTNMTHDYWLTSEDSFMCIDANLSTSSRLRDHIQDLKSCLQCKESHQINQDGI